MFNRKTYSQFILRFRKDDKEDMKLLKHLKKKESSTQYIKDLIAEGMNRK